RAEEAFALAGGRRSVPRYRSLGSRGAHGQGRGGVRSGRPHHRGASETGGGALRRPAVAQAVEVHAAHARAETSGGGGGGQPLRGFVAQEPIIDRAFTGCV